MSDPTSAALVESLLHDGLALLAAFHVEEPAARRLFAELTRRYSEAGRFYHDLRHLRDVLDTIGSLRELTRNLPAVQLAAWFHDAVWDAQSADNEERSADLADARLTDLRLPAPLIEAVRKLILLTRTHQAESHDRDGHVLIDADLAILGAPEDAYDRYAEAIRREYAWVPEEQYRIGRARVLTGFLERDRIYQTQPLFAAREAQARHNLARELHSLG